MTSMSQCQGHIYRHQWYGSLSVPSTNSHATGYLLTIIFSPEVSRYIIIDHEALNFLSLKLKKGVARDSALILSLLFLLTCHP